jgi:hypothetical protein
LNIIAAGTPKYLAHSAFGQRWRVAIRAQMRQKDKSELWPHNVGQEVSGFLV